MDILYTASQQRSSESQRRVNSSASRESDSPQIAETRGVPCDCTYLRSDSAAAGMGCGVCGGNIEGCPARRGPGLLRRMEWVRGGGMERRAVFGISGVKADGEMYEVSYEI